MRTKSFTEWLNVIFQTFSTFSEDSHQWKTVFVDVVNKGLHQIVTKKPKQQLQAPERQGKCWREKNLGFRMNSTSQPISTDFRQSANTGTKPGGIPDWWCCKLILSLVTKKMSIMSTVEKLFSTSSPFKSRRFTATVLRHVTYCEENCPFSHNRSWKYYIFTANYFPFLSMIQARKMGGRKIRWR